MMSLRARCGLLAFALCAAMQPASAEVLVLGSVNDNVRKHVKLFEPMAEHLEKELAEDGISEVRISVLPDSDAMAAALREGRVDLYFDSPLVAARVAREAGAEPILRRWKRGVATYHSIIIVPAASKLRTLEDLVGHKVGFQDPDSTSGFLLPMGMILGRNLSAVEIAEPHDDVREDAISYIFTRDDKNTILWLSRGIVDAAATDPDHFARLQNAFPDKYRILARSMEVPRQVVVRRTGMDPDLLAAVVDELKAMGDTEKGRETLLKFHKTTRFDSFPNGVEATFAPIYDLLDALWTWSATGE